MRSYTVTVPLLAAAAVNAAGMTPRALSLFPRQITSSTVPAACQSTCASTIAVYQACNSNDSQGCLQVCTQDTFDEFLSCFTCVLNDAGSVTASDEASVNNDLDSLKDECAAGGLTITGSVGAQVTATAANSGSSASVSDINSLVSDATSIITGFTSAASGVTIGAGTGASSSTGAARPSSFSAPSVTSTGGAVVGISTASSAVSAATSAAASAASSGTAKAASAAGPVLSAGRLVGAAAAIVAAVMVL